MKTNTINKTEEKEFALKKRKCPKCNKDLSIMACGLNETRVACACGFEIVLSNTPHQPDQTSELSLCQSCYCMTITVNGKCGKCKTDKTKTSDWREKLQKRVHDPEQYPITEIEMLDFIQSLLDQQEQRHQREMKDVIKRTWRELDGLDCGFCNYGDEVKERLDQISQSIKEKYELTK